VQQDTEKLMKCILHRLALEQVKIDSEYYSLGEIIDVQARSLT